MRFRVYVDCPMRTPEKDKTGARMRTGGWGLVRETAGPQIIS